jgi:hypothetical protein
MSGSSPLQAVLAHGATEHTKSYRTTSQSLSQTVCGPGEGSPASSLRSIQSYFKAPTFPSSTPVEVYPYESSGEEGSVYAKLKRGLVSREEQSSYPTRCLPITLVVSSTILIFFEVVILGPDSSQPILVFLKIVMMTVILNVLVVQPSVLLANQVQLNLNHN